jgi:hypothetical protein
VHSRLAGQALVVAAVANKRSKKEEGGEPALDTGEEEIGIGNDSDGEDA